MNSLRRLFDQYEKMFGDMFPTIPLAWGRTDEEVAEIVKECLDKKKDVYQLGYCKHGVVY